MSTYSNHKDHRLKIHNSQPMPQETYQKTFKFVKCPKGEINFLAPPAADSKQFKPAFVSFKHLYRFLCGKIMSNFVPIFM